ncbi:hypothetical protein IC575_006316 [Cucumis melo]
MAKKAEERFEAIEQEIINIQTELQRIPMLEAKITKHLEKIDSQNEQNQHQQQLILQHIEGMMKGQSTTRESEGSTSKAKTKVTEPINEGNENEKNGEEKNNDRSKFKKVEMLVFNGEDPDAWLFRADRYFQIHMLTDSKKMTVATISFEGPALNWYRAQEERDKFKDWENLKERLLVRFRSTREGSICGQFLRIQQESSVEEYRNKFDRLMAPVSDLPDRVIEETFMGGLFPWIKAEVEFCRPIGLAEMMLLAQLMENREKIRNEAGLKGHSGGKYPFYPSSISKSNNTVSDKRNTTFPMRTITLKSNPIGETKKEGTSKRLSEAEFQARKEKGLYFRCNEKYSHDHKCKNKEQRELRMYVIKSEDEEFEIIEEANYEEK